MKGIKLWWNSIINIITNKTLDNPQKLFGLKVSNQTLYRFFRYKIVRKIYKFTGYCRTLIRIIYHCFYDQILCTHCGSAILREPPGMFLDFDADPERGGDCLPLCSCCLGTGVITKNVRFFLLGGRVRKIRKACFAYQLNASRKKIMFSEQWPTVRAYRNQLRNIAWQALLLVRRPVKNCYAQELVSEIH